MFVPLFPTVNPNKCLVGILKQVGVFFPSLFALNSPPPQLKKTPDFSQSGQFYFSKGGWTA
jgi:hypothetical protein